LTAPDIDLGTLDSPAQNAPSLDVGGSRFTPAPAVPSLMEYTDSDDIMLYTDSTDKMEYV